MKDSQEDFKKKREEYAINIRRNNRAQLINKRRNLSSDDNPDKQAMVNEAKPTQIVDARYQAEIEQLINAAYDESMFDELAACLSSREFMLQHKGIIGMRILMSKNVDPPIKRFVDRGLINICIWLVKQKEYPQIRLEATWTLTNVASGLPEFCQKIVEKGGIQLFIGLLQENENGIVDQAIWGIGNLAADNHKYRDEILKLGGLDVLLKLIESSKNKTIVRNSSWAVSNLCRGYPAPSYQLIKRACPVLCRVIKSGVVTEESPDILSDVLWAIAYLSEGSKSKIQTVNSTQVLPHIFKYAVHPYKQIYIPSIKIIGNFSNGNENHNQELLNNGIFELSLKLMEHPKKSIRREICWVLSNVAAGVKEQVEAFMQRKDLLDKLALLFYQDLPQIKREVCWIYANFGHLGDRPKLIQLCLHYDLMRIYSNLLNEEDADILENALETLYKLLVVGSKHLVNDSNILLVKLFEYGGGDRLEALQQHPNRKVYDGTVKILTKFCELVKETL